MDWSDGDVMDIGYTFGYDGELNPLRTAPAFTHAGIAHPPVRRARELGFGQRLSVVIHAAASGIEWWGTDFNPAHAAFAGDLAMLCETPVHLFDEAFYISYNTLPGWAPMVPLRRLLTH